MKSLVQNKIWARSSTIEIIQINPNLAKCSEMDSKKVKVKKSKWKVQRCYRVLKACKKTILLPRAVVKYKILWCVFGHLWIDLNGQFQDKLCFNAIVISIFIFHNVSGSYCNSFSLSSWNLNIADSMSLFIFIS